MDLIDDFIVIKNMNNSRFFDVCVLIFTEVFRSKSGDQFSIPLVLFS